MNAPDTDSPALQKQPAITETQSDESCHGWAAAGLIAIFFALNLIALPGLERTNYDERYYTNGAIRMLETGDYLTPRWEDDSGRFNKPVLTYWVVAASYKLFGVSLVSSRLPFLLIGCLILFVSYRLAGRLFGSQAGTLAVAMLVCNTEFNRTCCFAMTDGLLTLGLLISTFGFMQLLVLERRTASACACAYLGGGMAVATKGLVYVPFAIFGWVFAILWLRRSFAPRKLIHVPAMAAGAAVGLGWMATMLCLHGSAFIKGFGKDQAGMRFAGSLWWLNWLFYPAVMALFYIPWLIPIVWLLLRDRARLLSAFVRHKMAFCYLLGWVAALVLVFMPGNRERARYMMPAFPVIAVFLSGWLAALDRDDLLRTIWRVLAWVVAALALLAATIFVVIGPLIDSRVREAGWILAVCAIALRMTVRMRSRLPHVWLAAFGCVAFLLGDVWLSAPFHATPTPGVAALVRAGTLPPSLAVVDTPAPIASPPYLQWQLRVLLSGNVPVEKLTPDAVNARRPAMLAFCESQRAALQLDGYSIQSAAVTYEDFRLRDFLREWRAGHADAYMEARRQHYYLATRQ